MHVRIIDVEGTPEEIAALPQLTEVLGVALRSGSLQVCGAPGGPASARESDNAHSGLPADVLTVLRLRRPATEIYELIVSFLKEALSWPDVEARVGKSRRRDDGMANAIRLHRRGSTAGAFTYLRLPGGTTIFRLSVDFSHREVQHAKQRQVSGDAPYGLSLKLVSAAALQEALELASAACDAARLTVLEPEEAHRPVVGARMTRVRPRS